MLSNFYVEKEKEKVIPLFKWGGLNWASAEHLYHAGKFIKSNPDFYKLFSMDSLSPFSTDPKKAKSAGGKSGIYREKKDGKTSTTLFRKEEIKMDEDFNYEEHMEKVLEAKFTQNAKSKEILLATKNAKLVHYVAKRGKRAANKTNIEVWNHLMRIRKKIRS